jgi:hypothetical protein
MPQIDLEDTEWNAVMAQLAEGPWRTMNPLLIKIGAQLQVLRQGGHKIAIREARDPMGDIDRAMRDMNNNGETASSRR